MDDSCVAKTPHLADRQQAGFRETQRLTPEQPPAAENKIGPDLRPTRPKLRLTFWARNYHFR
jgi:hypothetical protein